MKLTEFPKSAPYTMTEFYLFATLPQDGRRIGSADIVKARGDKWDVKYPLKSVTVQMNRLIDKIDANRESFRIGKEGRYPGHPEVEYWLEGRKAVPRIRRRVNEHAR